MLTSPISSFFCPTRIHLGIGAHTQLASVLQGYDCQRLFIALDRALQGGDFYQRIEAILAEQNIATAVFTDIEADPSDTTVERAFAVCRAHNATAILAVGGGSTMDVAKAVMTDGKETFPLVPVAVGLYSIGFNIFNTLLMFPVIGVFDRVLSRIGASREDE